MWATEVVHFTEDGDIAIIVEWSDDIEVSYKWLKWNFRMKNVKVTPYERVSSG